MKKLLIKTAAFLSLVTAMIFSGCCSAFAQSENTIDYQTGQDNSLIVICTVIIGLALAAIIIMLILKKFRKK